MNLERISVHIDASSGAAVWLFCRECRWHSHSVYLVGAVSLQDLINVANAHQCDD